MIRKFKIEGLDCPNCAKALEGEINKLSSVKSAKINFVKAYIEIEADDMDLAVNDTIDIARKVEPDATIVVGDKKHKRFNKSFVIDTTCLLLGIVIAVLLFTLKPTTWLYWTMFVVSALLMGYKVYLKAFNLLIKGVVNENLLVTISVIGATAVGEHFDGLMVVALYSIGKILEGLALDKSKKSIEGLTNIRPEFAIIVDENDIEKRVEPDRKSVV